TVTAVDDSNIEGAHSVLINHDIDTVLTLDTAYDAVSGTLADVTANVTDNDSAGITITETLGSTDLDETGPTQDSYTVKLTGQPTGNVVVTVTSIDTVKGVTVDMASLTFTDTTWNISQTVTVTAVDDPNVEGAHSSIISHSASSSDTNFNGIGISDVTANITDNDTAGIIVSTISGDTTEAGGTATFTVVLNTQPTADVTITGIASFNGLEGIVDKSNLIFTTGNWNIPQTVTVTGQDDQIVDGNVAYSIQVNTAVSSDLDYDGIIPDNVVVINLDDDS
ncbi:unnamed protein product, partial [marine sediment metagenome]